MADSERKPDLKLTKENLAKWSKIALKAFWNFFRKGGWLVFLAFVADLVTKLAIQAAWAPPETAPEVPFISDSAGRIIIGFTLTYNKGMGYGLLSNQTALLAALSFVVGVGMIAFLAFHFDRRSWPVRYGLYLMIAGCFGNFIDRAFYPEGVIDWIVVGNSTWPAAFSFVCNIADIALTVGILILVIGLLAIYLVDLNRTQKAKKIKDQAVANAGNSEPVQKDGNSGEIKPEVLQEILENSEKSEEQSNEAQSTEPEPDTEAEEVSDDLRALTSALDQGDDDDGGKDSENR